MFKLKASHAFTTYKKRRDAKLVAECTEPVILHSGMSTWCQLAKSWMTTVLSELPSWGLSCLLPPGFMVVNWRTSPDAKMRVVGAKEKEETSQHLMRERQGNPPPVTGPPTVLQKAVILILIHNAVSGCIASTIQKTWHIRGRIVMIRPDLAPSYGVAVLSSDRFHSQESSRPVALEAITMKSRSQPWRLAREHCSSCGQPSGSSCLQLR